MDYIPMRDEPLSPRAARTRSALLSAGLALLAERPIDAIAIDEVVALAGVAKGSFFNHFVDKQRFASAVEREIRLEIEAWVSVVNTDTHDPLERLAGGMIAAAAYSAAKTSQTIIVARTSRGLALEGHPINAGLLNDLRHAKAEGLVELPSERGGLLFWLGCCQALMGSIVESRGNVSTCQELLQDMLVLGLRGLSAPQDRFAAVVKPGHLQAKSALLSSL